MDTQRLIINAANTARSYYQILGTGESLTRTSQGCAPVPEIFARIYKTPALARPDSRDTFPRKFPEDVPGGVQFSARRSRASRRIRGKKGARRKRTPEDEVGFARGCQRGRNRGCRFEQELGCYANWKDNNRLSEDGCVDGLADEHSTPPHLENTLISLHLSLHPFRIAHPDLPQGKLYSLPSTCPRSHRPSNTLPVPSAFIPFRVSPPVYRHSENLTGHYEFFGHLSRTSAHRRSPAANFRGAQPVTRRAAIFHRDIENINVER